jgi:hypothetical protein
VGRDDADQVTDIVDQGCGLDRPESCRVGDLAMWREVRVSADIGHDDLRALPGRSSACGLVIVNDREVIQEFWAEAGLGNDLQ